MNEKGGDKLNQKIIYFDDKPGVLSIREKAPTGSEYFSVENN